MRRPPLRPSQPDGKLRFAEFALQWGQKGMQNAWLTARPSRDLLLIFVAVDFVGSVKKAAEAAFLTLDPSLPTLKRFFHRISSDLEPETAAGSQHERL